MTADGRHSCVKDEAILVTVQYDLNTEEELITCVDELIRLAIEEKTAEESYGYARRKKRLHEIQTRQLF